MESKKVFGLLGIARKAGKLVTGTDDVIDSARNGKVKMIFLATDASDRTKKVINDKASYYDVEVVELFDEDELSHSIGSKRKVIGINDDGFVNSFRKLIKGV